MRKLVKNDMSGKCSPPPPPLAFHSRLTRTLILTTAALDCWASQNEHFCVSFFQICLVVASVFGVIVYRVAVFASLTAAYDGNITSISFTVTATAAVINLILILLLSYVSVSIDYSCFTADFTKLWPQMFRTSSLRSSKVHYEFTNQFVNNAFDWLLLLQGPIRDFAYKWVCEFQYELPNFATKFGTFVVKVSWNRL
jgi:hypothetical protein